MSGKQTLVTSTRATVSSLVAQTVKHLSAMLETWVPSLGQEDPLEKWQTTSVFLPGESHGQRSLVGYGPYGHKELDTTKLTACVQAIVLVQGYKVCRMIFFSPETKQTYKHCCLQSEK